MLTSCVQLLRLTVTYSQPALFRLRARLPHGHPSLLCLSRQREFAWHAISGQTRAHALLKTWSQQTYQEPALASLTYIVFPESLSQGRPYISLPRQPSFLITASKLGPQAERVTSITSNIAQSFIRSYPTLLTLIQRSPHHLLQSGTSPAQL